MSAHHLLLSLALLIPTACSLQQRPVEAPVQQSPVYITDNANPQADQQALHPATTEPDNSAEAVETGTIPEEAEPSLAAQETLEIPVSIQPSEPAALFVENRDNLDPANPAFGLLQRPMEAMSRFPTDRYGRIDWVRTLIEGHIDPRAEADRYGRMRLKQEVVVMKNTREMPHVLFPHLQHTRWLDCGNCHPYPFDEKISEEPITMEQIMRGEGCGMCHDRVAFSIIACERCHSIPHEGSPRAWW